MAEESIQIYAVIPAAGKSTRMQAAVSGSSKVFYRVSDSTPTILELSLITLLQSGILRGVVLAVRPADHALALDLLAKVTANFSITPEFETQVVAGGRTRQESVYNALRVLSGKAQQVLIHDAARPLCRPEEVRAVANECIRCGAAILACPIHSTVKRADSAGHILETVARDGLYLAQTPQAFSLELILAAHAAAVANGLTVTDDSELVERFGHPVTIVPGSPNNIKITTADDLALLRAFVP